MGRHGTMKEENWLKRKYQRLTTGFEHREAFDFVSWHAQIVIPRLRFLKENHSAYPKALEKKIGRQGMTELQKNQEWEKVLDKVIFSFENINLKNNKKVEKGLILFGKFYTDLFD